MGAGQKKYTGVIVRDLRLPIFGCSFASPIARGMERKAAVFTSIEFLDGIDELDVAEARRGAAEPRKTVNGGAPSDSASHSREPVGLLQEQVDIFQKRYAALRVKRPEAYRWQFDKYVIPYLGSRHMAQISRRELTEHLDFIADRHGVTTARRVGGLLKRFFKFAVSRDIIEKDPAAALILPGLERRRERTLSTEEIRALWLATDSSTKTAARNKAGGLKPHPSD